MPTPNANTNTTTRSGLFVIVLALASGCSSPQRTYAWTGVDPATNGTVTFSQGPMPSGQTYTGVYRSPEIGDLQLVQTGDSIVGRYEYDRANCHVLGRIEGSATGNLFRFDWTEDTRACGHIEMQRGRGFFLYEVNDDEFHRGRLFGRWGYSQDDRGGGPWTGFKVPNRQPTIPEAQGNSGGGGDNSGGSSGGDNGGGSSGGDNSGGSSGGGSSGGGSSGGGSSGGSNLGI